ncbi:MAG: uL15 family ribosomal protein [Clostridia bacterium]|nr:uL15 family ribosomal protein [Clostridia bacterium]
MKENLLSNSLFLSNSLGWLDWIFVAIAVISIVVIMAITSLSFNKNDKEKKNEDAANVADNKTENAEENSEEKVEEKTEEAVAEETLPEESKTEETAEVQEKVAILEDEDVDDDIVFETYKENGVKHQIKYDRSVSGKLCLTKPNTVNYYSEVKNYILSYKDVKAKMSWKYEAFNKLKENLFKLAVKKNVLCVYLDLTQDEVSINEYDYFITTRKPFLNMPNKGVQNTPIYVKVKSKADLKKCKELIDRVMAKHELVVNEKAKVVDYTAKFLPDTVDNLVEKGLIKKYIDGSSSKNLLDVRETQLVEEDVPVAEEPVAEPETQVEEPKQEEVQEEPEVKEEKVKRRKDKPKVEVVEEVEEMEEVSVSEVDKYMSDERAQNLVEKEVVTKTVIAASAGKYTINVDTLEQYFNDGDTITIDDLKNKNLIDKKADSYKVLARGKLSKRFTVKADDFSMKAMKMIELVGGKVVILVDEE